MDRAVTVVMWLAAALVLANAVVAWVDLDAWMWRAPAYFPPINPIGADFRNGAYEGARTFSSGDQRLAAADAGAVPAVPSVQPEHRLRAFTSS